ncbi:MAG: hypothetical protein WD397_00390 [Wenzhouxiangellaceae bacterium]
MTEASSTTHSESGHDLSLLRWFAELSPEQRLAELDSRIAFFHSLRLLDLEELIEQK